MVLVAKKLSGLLIAGILLVAACQQSGLGPVQAVLLGLNQSARLSSGVLVRVDSIQDSRCPSGAQCIWAGEAKVKLTLSKAPDSTVVRLVLAPAVQPSDPKRRDSTNVLVGSQTYKVILRGVSPYPSTTNLNQPPSAVVEVTGL